MKILLGRDDVNPNRPDKLGKTPVWSGHEGVVKMLLGRDDVNPDKPDKCRRTPLWWAARNGHVGAVEILLRRDGVDPNKRDDDGKSNRRRAIYENDLTL